MRPSAVGRLEVFPPPEVLAGSGSVTAISGLTFVISDEVGDIRDGTTGLIAGDTRHLSELRLTVAGQPLQQLGSGLLQPSLAQFRGQSRAIPHRLPDAPLESQRLRRVSTSGFTDEMTLMWWEAEDAEVEVSLVVDADFADIFEVRQGRADPARRPVERRLSRTGSGLLFAGEGGRTTSVQVGPRPDRLDGAGFMWRRTIGRGRPLVLSVAVRAGTGVRVAPAAAPRPRRPSMPPSDPTVTSRPPGLAMGSRHSLADLDRFAMADPLDPSRRLVAAGIPWFVALFGRDALVASFQAQAFRPGLMLDTLHALAARQGRVEDPANEEQPGKILHEVRLSDQPWLGEGTTAGRRPYFGSIDATPLFLILYGQAFRWGAPRAALRTLLPAARAALEWMRRHGDPDGDGLIEYGAGGGRTLVNQGWKDSENAVQFADGRLARPPIAIVEVQAYAYRARRELAAVLRYLGQEGEADDLDREADAVRSLARGRYWLPGDGERPGLFALALDAEKRPVDAVASNMGHLLWCGVPSNQEAEQVAEHLLAPGMASGWGLRTLASEMAGYNPISYHVGSVWPHDTAIACEGLRRYGHDAAAGRLARDLMDAMDGFDGRLPELFGGQRREPGDFPVPYPTACRPQAWAAGVPLAFIPTFLGLEPDVHARTVQLHPSLPPGVAALEVRGLPLGEGRLSLEVEGTSTRLIEAPSDIRVQITSAGGRPAAR